MTACLIHLYIAIAGWVKSPMQTMHACMHLFSSDDQCLYQRSLLVAACKAQQIMLGLPAWVAHY